MNKPQSEIESKAKDKSACQTHLGETPAKSPLVLKIGLQHLGDMPANEPLLKGDCELVHFHSGPLSDTKKFEKSAIFGSLAR